MGRNSNSLNQVSRLPVFDGWGPMMVWSRYSDNEWSPLEVGSVGSLPIHPGSMAVQFGASVFEGAKARRTSMERINLFRTEEHYRRIKKSAERVCLAYPSEALYRSAVETVVTQQDNWEKPFKSEWLYLRPLLFALDDHIMPIIAKNGLFVILAAPIRPFTPSHFSLVVERSQHRATPGGLGAAKTAANYAHQFHASRTAQTAGHNAVLWLSPLDGSTIEEASTMNVFFVIDGKVITPKTSDTILPGITRKSVIALLQADNIFVEERDISIEEIHEAINNRRLKEMFVTSTALGVRAVDYLQLAELKLPAAPDPSLSVRLSEQLQSLFAGNTCSSTSGWLHTVDMAGGIREHG